MSSETEIIRVMMETDDISSLIKLKITDTLLEVRERLEQDSTIRMDDNLLFLDSESFEIPHKSEANFKLKKLITNDNTIYLRNREYPINYIKGNLKLEYGRTLNPNDTEIIVADNPVFTIENKNIKSAIPNENKYDKEVKFNSKENWENKINLFLNAEAEMMNFGSIGIDFSINRDENQQVEKNYSCKCTKVPKMTLKFDKMKPTPKFVEDVEKAIKSESIEEFKEIYKNFGQFVPTKIILGGTIYDVTESESNEYSEQKNLKLEPKIGINSGIPGVNLQGGPGLNLDGSNTNSASGEKKYRCQIGGKPQGSENFNEDEWIDSLSDHDTWKCIEFQNPINIFQLLDGNDYLRDLRKKVYELFGKKILYSKVMDFNCQLDYGEQQVVKLDLKGKICKTIKNKDAKCSVFATVVSDDKKKNDFFNCQIYHPQDDIPRLIINCYQRNQKSRTPNNLKIGFMIIGYDVDFNNNTLNDDEMQLNVYHQDYQNPNDQELEHEFKFDFNFDDVNSFLGIPVLSKLNNSNNSILIGHYFFKNGNNIVAKVFSYNLRENKYVKLPNCGFQVLTISGLPEKTIITFKKRLMSWGKYINIKDIEKCWTDKDIPKYISVYSVYSENCGPVFLKQKKKEIKLKHADCKCKECPFYKNRPSESNVKCTYFVSNTSDESKSHYNLMQSAVRLSN
ncbi:hypothetical protein C1645_851820 [Glomus cerebriforme]|uniref:Uncharacterized protein n=1 Tax=Glomus cerebriforme TaxID=658196 RepID=A0A397SWC9_9GLOM|nr:hypothetical protein C1645_851820 [Glomus cerebriforme]